MTREPSRGPSERSTIGPLAEQRIGAIEAKQGQAALLLAAATQQPMREQVRLALRDLEEGLQWLRNDDPNARPFALEIVDGILRLATSRLNMVKKALQTDGPDATLKP